MGVLRVVCLSDTHGRHGRVAVPEGDVLVHAGDFTKRGTAEEVEAFGGWLAGLGHRVKVVVAGNHDFLFEREPGRARGLLGDVVYLEDEGEVVEGVRVWGAPWQPWFHDWAFNLPRGERLAEKWALVPEGVELLVTHGPPMGVMDRVWSGQHVGCEELARALGRIRPRVHLFGHIHEAYGVRREGGVLSINASICNLLYRPVNAPVVIDWDGVEWRVVQPSEPS